MKPFINFRMHSTGSDGKLTPEEVIKQSIKAGIKYLCFTDHYHPPKGMVNFGENFHSEVYVKEVESLKEKYKGKIEIFFGAEFDWIESNKNWTENEIKKKKYDFVLGAVHFLFHKKGRIHIFSIDYSKEESLEAMKEFEGLENYIKEYYIQLRKMVKSGLFDCVAHLDLIKIFNKDSTFFSEKADWYIKEVLESLNEIKKAGMCIEINTSGLRWPAGEQYPSKWILEEARKRDIPITIGTDGHEKVSQDLEKAFDLAKEAGYNSILIFKNRKPIKLELK